MKTRLKAGGHGLADNGGVLELLTTEDGKTRRTKVSRV